MNLDELCWKDKEFILNAVKRHGWFLQYVDESLKGDKEVVMAAVKQFGLALQYANEPLKRDKEVVLEAVKKNRMAFEFVAEPLKKDRDFVMGVIKENGRVLELADRILKEDRELVLSAAVQKHNWPPHYVNPSLWEDRDFVLAEVKKDGSALECVSDSLKKDKELVSIAVRQHRWALQYADSSLRGDREIVLAGVRRHGWALEYADPLLWRDKEFVLCVVKNNGEAFRFADESLKNDKEFVLRVVKENGWALKYAGKSLKRDREMLSVAAENNDKIIEYLNSPDKYEEEALPKEPYHSFDYYDNSLRRIITAWSGGKDGCLALHRTIRNENYNLVYLVNFVSKESKRISFHEINPKLLQLQMNCIGVPFLQKETTPDGYQKEYKEAVGSLVIPQGIDIMVFGDIYVDEHKTWVENVCEDVGIQAIEPLWSENTEDLVRKVINSGIESYVISVKEGMIDKGWTGKKLNEEFIDYLKGKGVDPCGEYGEYHTFVTDSPFFKKRINLIDTEIVKIGDYWVLNIMKYCSIPK